MKINVPLDTQFDANRSTEANWDLYTAHREQVTRLMLDALSQHPSGRACVLGAGNCNDLGLSEVAKNAAEIHLIDVDGTALDRGQARAKSRITHRQGMAALICHAGIDLTGLSANLFNGSVGSMESIVEQALEGPTINIGQPFDVVISTGLLTQLFSLPVDVLGADHPLLNPVILAVRTGHMRLMSTLLKPGGHGVLVTDIVSSDTIPGLADAAHETLTQLLIRSIKTGNFFTGTNPLSLVEALRTDPQLAIAVSDVSLSKPWLWQVGPVRTYLTVALTFRRVADI